MRAGSLGVVLLFVVIVGACGGGSSPPGSNGGSSGGSGTGGAQSGRGGSGGAASGGAGSGGTAEGGRGGSGGDAGSTAGSGGTAQGGRGGSGGAAGSGGTAPAIAVTGTVLLNLEPLAGVPVTVAGHTLITDAAGRFTAADVTAPYDLTLVLAAQKQVRSYIGVTRADPVLNIFQSGNNRTVTFRGALSGGAGFPAPAQHQSALALVTDRWTRTQNLDPTGATYEAIFNFVGPATANATLIVLQYRRDTSGLVVDYTGHARRTLAIADTGTFTADLNLAAVTERTVSGTISAPAQSSLSMSLRVETLLPIAGASVAGPSYAVVVPQGLTFTPQLEIAAAASDGSAVGQTKQILDQVTSENFALPQGTTLGAPANAATGVDRDTEFSWTPGFDGGHVVAFSIGGWDIRVATQGTRARLPADVPVPAGADGQWVVYSQDISVDELVAIPPITPVRSSARGASSVTRTFRTAP